MRELFFELFGLSHFDTGITITAFSLSHIVYLILIVGAIVGTYYLMRKRPMEDRVKLLSCMALALVISYLSDFFIHELP